MRGMRAKLRSGGGQLVAHSSDAPCPHGSSTSTMRPVLYDFHTLYRNGSVEMPMMNDPAVEISFSVVQPSEGRQSKYRRGIPSPPAQCCTRNVVLKPMRVSQKWTLPQRSSIMRPVIFGNQK